MNKEKYRKFCKTEINIPIFSKDWWLDSVCGENNWDVILFEKNEKIWATMPYCRKKILWFNILSMAQLTQTMGPYMKYPANQGYYRKLSWEKEIMNEFIKQLPKFDRFSQNFHYSITNWLPFYWKGFTQTTRYTYVIEDLSNLDMLLKDSVSKQARKMINKARKRVDIIESNDSEAFYNMVKMTYKRQNRQAPYSYEFFKNLDNECAKYNSRKIFFALDKVTKEIHVALYIVFDEKSVYTLASGANPELRNSGAENLLDWEAIQFASKEGKILDYEGSMIENIEKHARSFGYVQKPYFSIKKNNGFLMKIIDLLRSR